MSAEAFVVSAEACVVSGELFSAELFSARGLDIFIQEKVVLVVAAMCC